MKMNRRNVLIGIGAAVTGSGAALGSGAFTSVSASRTVGVTVANDDSATLGLSSSNNYLTSNGSSGTISFDVEGGNNADGLNDDAITVINNIATITNNADSGNVVVSLEAVSGSGSAPTGVSSVDTSGSNADTVAYGSGSVSVATGSSSPEAVIDFELPSQQAQSLANSGDVSDGTESTSLNATIRTGSEKPSSVPSETHLVIIAQQDTA